MLAVLCAPLLSQVMPVSQAISLALPLLIIGDVFALRVYWNMWDNHYIKLLLPAAIVGILIGTYMLANLPDDILRRLLGIFTLMFVIYKLFGNRLLSANYKPRNWHGVFVGGIAGIGSAVANVGGPPFTAYMLLQPIAPQMFVGTMTLFFALVNVIKLPFLLAAGLYNFSDLLTVLWVIPVIPFGVWLGRYVITRIDQAAFERLMLAALTIVAVFLIVVPPT